LIGKSFDEYLLLWDKNDDIWYNNGPVILLCCGKQYEFDANKLDEYSFTIDKINLEAELKSYSDLDLFDLYVTHNVCAANRELKIGTEI
jgi:hypothetical protein